MSLPVDFGRGLVQIGPALPKKSEAAGLAWPNGNDLQAGEVFYFLGAGSTSNVDGAFFMAANAVSAASNADPSNSIKDFIRVGAFEDDTIQTVETLPVEKTVTTIDANGQPATTTQMEMDLEDGKVYYHQGTNTHFLVSAQPETITGSQEFITAFNPNDAQWKNNFHIFTPDPTSGLEAPSILRRSAPTGWNVSGGALVEVNVGVAEAIVQDGEIKSLNILNQGTGLSFDLRAFCQKR